MKISATFLGVLVFLLSTQSVNAADQRRDNGITATGTCLKKVAQDRGAVTFTTNVLASTSTESSQQATKENQKLRAALQALKLENATLETESYSVNEDREYIKDKWISRGYRTRIGLTIETSDIARLGEAVAAASKLGVKQVENLTTFVSPAKHKAEYEACLEIATRNARDKAEKLAKGAGVRLGKVMAISEGGVASGNTRNTYAKAMLMSGAPSSSADEGPTVDTKPEDLSVSATVMFEAD